MVSPNSGRSEVQDVDRWRKRLVVRLRSPPEKGAANEELESLLTEFFGARTTVARGHTNRMKTVIVEAGKDLVVDKLRARR